MTDRKRKPVTRIEYRIPTPEEAKRLIAEGRELRRELEKQLAPMSKFTDEELKRRAR